MPKSAAGKPPSRGKIINSIRILAPLSRGLFDGRAELLAARWHAIDHPSNRFKKQLHAR